MTKTKKFIITSACVLTVATILKKNLKLLKQKQKRKFWVREIFLNRDELGFFEVTYKQIKAKDPEKFFSTFRMSPQTFDKLLANVMHQLQKSSYRLPIQPECRLALTLSYVYIS